MLDYQQRDLIVGEDQLKKIFRLASHAGYEIIELRNIQRGQGNPTKIIGFEIPVQLKTDGGEDSELEITTGTVFFYPDSSGYCWGYVLDTPTNRHIIATSLSSGRFKVANKKVSDEINEYANKNNIRTEIEIKPDMYTKYTKREKEYQGYISEKNEEIAKLKEKLIDLEKQKNAAIQEEAESPVKPLAGVRLKK